MNVIICVRESLYVQVIFLFGTEAQGRTSAYWTIFLYSSEAVVSFR